MNAETRLKNLLHNYVALKMARIALVFNLSAQASESSYSWFVCVKLYECVFVLSAASYIGIAIERCQRVQRNDLLKMLRSKVMAYLLNTEQLRCPSADVFPRNKLLCYSFEAYSYVFTAKPMDLRKTLCVPLAQTHERTDTLAYHEYYSFPAY